MIPKIIAIVLLCLFLVKESRIIMKLEVKTAKSNFDKISIVIGVFVLMFITYYFARTPLDYAFAVVGIVTVLVMSFKQGITKDGIVITARGKDTFNWSDIGKVEINEYDLIRITYFSPIGSPIIKQQYSHKNRAKIMSILEENNMITK